MERIKAASLGQDRNWGISAIAGTAVDTVQLKTLPVISSLSRETRCPGLVTGLHLDKYQLWLGNEACWGHPTQLGL